MSAGRGKVAGDEDLVALLCARDMDAFEELYRRYHPRLTRFLLNILRHYHLAEEALNDTMMVVWKKPERFNGSSQVSTWIFGIAYRTALKTRSRYKEPASDEHMLEQPTDDLGAEIKIGGEQVRAILMRAIGHLSTDHRTVIDLTYFHHMGCSEIADIIGCPVGTVKTRLYHARKQIKAALPEHVEEWM